MKLLVKVATELNVGLSTIVEHLQDKGFEIDNKPTAKVTDEMYAELIKEFHGSIKEKEEADQLQKHPTVITIKEKPKIAVDLFGDSTTAVTPPPPPFKEKHE
jgi:translation initiation factor IF-2